MMVAHGIDENGDTLVILGLEPRNLELLQKGMPIDIPAGNDGLKGAGLSNVRIVITFGQSIEALKQQVPIGPETKVFDHRRKPS